MVRSRSVRIPGASGRAPTPTARAVEDQLSEDRMTDRDLTQAHAEALLVMDKYRRDDTPWDYSGLGKITLPLVSSDRRESFLLDIRRSRIKIAKGTFQNRARHLVILARLDFGGAPHRNPDGQEIASPHLHLYRKGFNDKWAFPVPLDAFPNLPDYWRTFDDFMVFCNVVAPPIINRGVFT